MSTHACGEVANINIIIIICILMVDNVVVRGLSCLAKISDYMPEISGRKEAYRGSWGLVKGDPVR